MGQPMTDSSRKPHPEDRATRMEKPNFAANFMSRMRMIDPQGLETSVDRLVKEKAFHQAVFDSLMEGIFVVDSEGVLVFHNEAARHLLGAGDRPLAGEPAHEAIRSPALRKILEEFGGRQEAINQREVRIRYPERRVYSISVLPIAGGEDEDPFSVWIVSDQTEAARRTQERHQGESIRSLATLIAGIAHEIKNPLNSLTIHAQLVASAARDFAETQKDHETPELQRLQRSTSVLQEEIQRLTRIVEQFIDAARPPRLDTKPCDVNAIVTAVADLIRPECTERRIDLVCALESDLPAISLDGEQVQQAILNIAKNAMEAIDKPDGEIVLRTALRDRNILIEVEDNGCGIPEGERLRIFEPYHTTKFNGSGLGLMVVFRIVSAHRGEISLDSQVGEGTTFSIALPLDETGEVKLLEERA